MTQKGLRRCQNCGAEFKPYHSGERYCGANKECDDAAAEDEREAEAQRRESAEADDFMRY